MSEVRVDESALAAEADSIAQEFAASAPVDPAVPVAPGEPTQPTEEQVLAGYRMISYAVADRGFGTLAPAWGVTDAEKTKLAEAMANALILWFPDMPIPPKYLALLIVADVGLEIVNARKDPATGKLKPLTHAPAKPASAGPDAATA